MQSLEISKEKLKEEIIENLKVLSRKTIETATREQLYQALVFSIKDIVSDKWIETHDVYNKQDVKMVYYLSMEFLTGRFLGNTILNLCASKEVREALEELGINYNELEDAERDPGLGNGGLGRLAACFLDSLSTLGYPAYGCGIRYHNGIFRQKIENGYQLEIPDNWLADGDLWGVKRAEYAVEVKFGGSVSAVEQPNGKYEFEHKNYYSVMAIPYDYPILGYNSNTVNTLRLWDAQAKNGIDLASFNAGNYAKAMEEQNLARILSEVLYPADDNMAGKELRLKQQYFFISASLQRILQRFAGMHSDFRQLPDYVQLQMNDTHPSMTVAELMRLLLDKYEIDWDTAWEITRKTCAYTNHTIMVEALEQWPIELFSRLFPRLYMIVEEINKRFCAFLIDKYGEDPEKIRKMAIVADGKIRMAYLAIVGSHSINGVARLHSEILKNQELKDFYHVYPERFNNKTNGITQRRWLALCNPGLAKLATEVAGNGWITDLHQLEKIMPYAADSAFQQRFMKIKRDNKVDLSNYIMDKTGLAVDPDSIFDIQIKRLHEYKRQLLNAINILDLYNRLKMNPTLDIAPRTFIFGAKASASYHRAKLIIKFINSVAELVNNDPDIHDRIKVLFMENYRVSLAEKLIPAADISEQISTAGKEASGTGNMKFMLNGALTIGTMDGANVEIHEEVGEENIFIFGMTADEVIALTKSGTYSPWDEYNMNYNLRTALTEFINGTLSPEDHNLFRELYESLLNGYGGSRADEYYILKDFQSYSNAQFKVDEAYKDQRRWAKSAIINTAKSGKFSSDRTIQQYAKEIWRLAPVEIKM